MAKIDKNIPTWSALLRHLYGIGRHTTLTDCLAKPFSQSRRILIYIAMTLIACGGTFEAVGMSEENATVEIKENIRPTISLHSNNSTITHHETLKLIATTNDSDGQISAVKFMLDGNLIETLNQPPYEIQLKPNVGSQRFSAIAIDDTGASSLLAETKVIVEPVKWRRTNGGNALSLNVKTKHPYLFVDESLIELILSSAKNEDLYFIDSIIKRNYIDNNKRDPCSKRGADTKAYMICKVNRYGDYGEFFSASMYYGINAYFNNTPESIEYAREFALAVIDFNNKTNNNNLRGKLFGVLGIIYDWIYEELSEVDKGSIRVEILKQMDYLENRWRYFSNPSYTGGHSRKANIYALAALLAMYHDVPNTDSDFQQRYYDYLGKVLNNLEAGYNPYLSWVSTNGGSEKDWSYGISYSSLEAHLIWKYATNEKSWFENSIGERFYIYLYGMRNTNNYNDYRAGGYHNFPYHGDTWATNYTRQNQGLPILIAINQYDNEYAKWLYETMPKDRSYWDVLYLKPNQTTGRKPIDLPLSRHFFNSGQVVIRDSWEPSINTLTVFKSTSFSSINHHHRDQNSFTIFYKGPLAIDSGGYTVMGAYGSKHWSNYYTRSVAHNTMLIYDRNETFSISQKEILSNDGGQIIRHSHYPSLEEMKSEGASHLDGIIHYQENPDFTYTMGDATKAYRDNKVELFQRHLLSLRNHSGNHPVVIVYDKVISKNKDFKKTYLLHSINKPIFIGNNGQPSDKTDTVKISIDRGTDPNDKATLYQQTLLPTLNNIKFVGGPGYEFWVDDDGQCANIRGNCTPQGHNYNENRVDAKPNSANARILREAGQWRIEVSPIAPSLDDRFLHVLSVTDDNGPDIGKVQADYISSVQLDAVLVRDNDDTEKTLVVFVKDNVALDQNLNAIANRSYKKLLVIGLIPYTRYNVTNSNDQIQISEDNLGRYRSTSEGTLYLDIGNTYAKNKTRSK